MLYYLHINHGDADMTTETKKAALIAEIDTYLSSIVQKAIDTNSEKLDQIKARRTDLLAHAASKPASFYTHAVYSQAIKALAVDYKGA